ncbi:hypothetical protein F4823DRAFT_503901 [Ustulina deusta]|nr:hypothetical protein F4823DRAFT_503901 [Ustulina deusta]
MRASGLSLILTMWLINVKTKTLEQFVDDTQLVPHYAILSHTWGLEHQEISFQELQRGEIKTGAGQYKFDECCSQAIRDGLCYAWIDTCCIDKTNSTELSEALNSMFKWYKNAKICYAYLCDVDAGENPLEPQSSFWKSRWFQRGWTLQELIAPDVLRFYDASWNHLGQKRDLVSALVPITRIPRVFLLGTFPLKEASVAQRMSWAADRVTKRKEDLAYCLLGIFEINMPMVYGEGEQAFTRLQEEIIRHTSDDSILAWNFVGDNPTAKSSEIVSVGALASSPAEFSGSSRIVVPSGPRRPLNTIGGSLQVKRCVHTDSSGQCFVILQCHKDDQLGQVVGIPVAARPGGYDDYIRLLGHPYILLSKDVLQTDLQDIRIPIERPDAVDEINLQLGFFIENTLEKDLQLSEVIPRSSWVEEKDILITNNQTRSGRLHRLWTMFRRQKNESDNFVLVLERYWQGSKPQVRHHVMTCNRTIGLDEIKQNFARIDGRDLNKHSASNDTLDLKVTVSLERVGKQQMFVVRLLRAEEKPDTYTVTNMLQNYKLELEVVNSFQKYHQADLNSKKLQTSIKEERLELSPTVKRLAEVRKKIMALQEEQHQLQKVEETAVSYLAKLRSRSQELDTLRDTLLDKAQTLQHRLDKQRRAITVAGNKVEDWTELAIKKMLKELPPKVRIKYESIPDPAHKFLLVAAQNGYELPFRELAKRNIDVNIANGEGESLISIAALHGHKRIVQTLLILGADIEAADENGWSALAQACIGGHSDIVRLLLDYGANIDNRDSRLRTPLFLAVVGGRLAVVEQLLDHGANTNSMEWSHSWTALMAAAMGGHERIAQLLLYRGANKDLRDRDGHTAQYWARRAGHPAVSRLLDMWQSEITESPKAPAAVIGDQVSLTPHLG